METPSSPLLRKLSSFRKKSLMQTLADTSMPLIRGDSIALALNVDSLETFSSLMSSSEDNIAISEPMTKRSPCTHHQLKQFVESFDLLEFGIAKGARVAVILPNGPELAVCLICIISQWCAAPINPASSTHELLSELESTKAEAILIVAGGSTNDVIIKAANLLGLAIILLSPSDSTTGFFHLSLQNPSSKANKIFGANTDSESVSPRKIETPQGSQRAVMLLHTSGTSGNKKLVPYSLATIVTGVGCIISSWELSSNDVCLNMMPLFHIGGIVRNVLSPVLSGGSIIACSGFDPIVFWDTLYSNGRKFTWYYAAPTMHHAIVSEAELRMRMSSFPLPVGTIRFIANAAGGLLPSLANSLRDKFQAVILTSYGMTECMPISSPPQSYALDPVGTSGIPVGPDIIIVDDDLNPLPVGVKGNIYIRGAPCFSGYENNGSANDESFSTINGKRWFNTGDMGSFDSNHYLFISGRSKEVINRGGETISPFEIEEAVAQHPFVKDTMAFSAPSDKFQETVGIVIVTKPGHPRIDLPALHKFVDTKLHRSKWPQVVVYMSTLPQNATGKIIRIRFAERISLSAIDEDASPVDRLFEVAVAPVQGAPLTEPIDISKVRAETSPIEDFLKKYDDVKEVAVIQMDRLFRQDVFVAFVVLHHRSHSETIAAIDKLREECAIHLDLYIAPDAIHHVDSIPLKIDAMNNSSVGSDVDYHTNSPIDKEELKRIALIRYSQSNVIAPRNSIEAQIESIWREQLGSALGAISVLDSFFEMGGDSLKAGQLVNAMRKRLRVQLSVADLFAAPTIELIARKIGSMRAIDSPTMSSSLADSKKDKDTNDLRYADIYVKVEDNFGIDDAVIFDSVSPHSSSSWLCLFLQSLPLLLILPMRRIALWFFVATFWVIFAHQGLDRFNALISALIVSRAVSGFGLPLIAVACKWIIIGKYIPGKYPYFGSYYLRWWIVEEIINILGKGFYRDDVPFIGSALVTAYWTLMGAKIGKNVRISRNAKLGQADLLTIGDDVTIDAATIRPFSVEEGFFVLLPISIGNRSSIGPKTTIAPGSDIEKDTCLGPLSSSHEIHEAVSRNRNYCRAAFQSPPWYLVLFVGIPILLFVYISSYIHWYFILQYMVNDAEANHWYISRVDSVWDAFLWWITPERIGYYFLLRVVGRCVVPFVHLFLTVVIKWTIIGRFQPMGKEEKEIGWNKFRYWLMSRLEPGGNLNGLTKLIGSHYEFVSIVYRLLGAKIGKHVYWPGSGLEIVEYDLLEVGDDVVFGSRTIVMTSSSERSANIVFESGSMIADRCVILPGVILRQGSVLGSGSLAAEDFEAPVGSVFVGSRNGCAVGAAPADQTYATKNSTMPFGKAFYKKEAPYYVIPLWAIVLYNTTWQALCSCYKSSPIVISLVVCNVLLGVDSQSTHQPMLLFEYTLVAFIFVHTFLSVAALAFDIAAKWILLGRRSQGVYSWDQSSYCQRWQIYLTLQEIRRGEKSKSGVLDLIQGSQYLVWYFRLLGSSIGENVCLYPNGGDPMMTEPDLVTIGHRAAIDDASLIAHINTRGVFRLNPVKVGEGCVLKSMARLLSGAAMENFSIMQEHTLVLSGESVDRCSVWQGWPSESQMPLEMYRAKVKRLLDGVTKRYVLISMASLNPRVDPKHVDRYENSIDTASQSEQQERVEKEWEVVARI